jgi:hypothetical protein
MDRIETDRNLSSDFGCRLCRENLHLYLEGEAAPLASREIREHLSRCPACTEEFRLLEEERVAFLEAAVSSPPLSPRFSERVIREIRREEAERSALRKIAAFRRLLMSAGAAAVIALAGLGIATLFSPLGPPEGTVASSPLGPVSSPLGPPEGTVVGHSPIDSSRGMGEEKAVVVVVNDGPSAHSTTAGQNAVVEERRSEVRMKLPDWFALSEEMFPAKSRPCESDLNEDGISDASDAAHLCMLAVLPIPADLRDLNLQDCDQI